MTDKPKNMVIAMRQLSTACSDRNNTGYPEWPEWFKEEWNKDSWKAWSTFISEAANELENMQATAGRYYKKLYPD
jgi:hypothetical protein